MNTTWHKINSVTRPGACFYQRGKVWVCQTLYGPRWYYKTEEPNGRTNCSDWFNSSAEARAAADKRFFP